MQRYFLGILVSRKIWRLCKKGGLDVDMPSRREGPGKGKGFVMASGRAAGGYVLQARYTLDFELAHQIGKVMGKLGQFACAGVDLGAVVRHLFGGVADG